MTVSPTATATGRKGLQARRARSRKLASLRRPHWMSGTAPAAHPVDRERAEKERSRARERWKVCVCACACVCVRVCACVLFFRERIGPRPADQPRLGAAAVRSSRTGPAGRSAPAGP